MTKDDIKELSMEELKLLISSMIEKINEKLNDCDSSEIVSLNEQSTQLEYALSEVNGIIDDLEFCHNESFSYRYQVPNFQMIDFMRKRAENNKDNVYYALSKYDFE